MQLNFENEIENVTHAFSMAFYMGEKGGASVASCFCIFFQSYRITQSVEPKLLHRALVRFWQMEMKIAFTT